MNSKHHENDTKNNVMSTVIRDTRRVEYICYERPTLDDGRIMFTRLELKNDDDVRSMFSIFWQHSMFPWIDMFVTLLRSTEDILNNLISPEDRD